MLVSILLRSPSMQLSMVCRFFKPRNSPCLDAVVKPDVISLVLFWWPSLSPGCLTIRILTLYEPSPEEDERKKSTRTEL